MGIWRPSDLLFKFQDVGQSSLSFPQGHVGDARKHIWDMVGSHVE